MHAIEHPDITYIRNHGYGPGQEEAPDPEWNCPVCGRPAEDSYYVSEDNEIIGCDQCVHKKKISFDN